MFSVKWFQWFVKIQYMQAKKQGVPLLEREPQFEYSIYIYPIGQAPRFITCTGKYVRMHRYIVLIYLFNLLFIHVTVSHVGLMAVVG